MEKMKTVALFFGGIGNEHEISIISAKNIFKNFPIKKYKVKLIYWAKDSHFYLVKDFNKLKTNRKRVNIENFRKEFDIALPITHGKYGEDGVLQGVFESQRIKYCGCRVAASSLCMDKSLFKNLLISYKINQVNFLLLDYFLDSKKEISSKILKINTDFKFPIYVKPANSGSSIGVVKVEKASQLKKAIESALVHDSKILIEEGIVNPKEIEVSVLGNNEVFVSQPGELKLEKDFYDYDNKYKLNTAEFIIPANISNEQKEEIASLSKKVYKICGCSGFSRIDFFVSKNKIYLNEVNTLPGFTSISMYAMLMEASGISHRKLLEKIIELAY